MASSLDGEITCLYCFSSLKKINVDYNGLVLFTVFTNCVSK